MAPFLMPTKNGKETASVALAASDADEALSIPQELTASCKRSRIRRSVP